ncbi:hypothetical protein D3272_00765 [Lichenibacterium ramalinae]|uniref:Uncharacterized protein n=1 Tax=Lichenibacterium ramalinae TaxID=2316527 RepID=A0A4Q2RGV8_9HYPH|nr:hypothetical protein D3272_00765 [Lichenibacterium ramalinae]
MRRRRGGGLPASLRGGGAGGGATPAANRSPARRRGPSCRNSARELGRLGRQEAAARTGAAPTPDPR